MRLRSLRSTDREPIAALLRATGAFAPEEIDVALELVDAALSHAAGTDYRFVVAARDPELLGYACFGPTPLADGVFDLYWIAVHPLAQGRGTGRALLAAVEDAVRHARGRMLLAETASKPEYAATRAFYARTGYAEVARIPDFYQPGDDKIVYSKLFT